MGPWGTVHWRGEAFPLMGTLLWPHVATLARLPQGARSHPPECSFCQAHSQKREVLPQCHQDANPILWTGVKQPVSPGAARTVAWTLPRRMGQPTSLQFLLLHRIPCTSLGRQGMDKAGRPSVSQEGQGILLSSCAA